MHYCTEYANKYLKKKLLKISTGRSLANCLFTKKYHYDSNGKKLISCKIFFYWLTYSPYGSPMLLLLYKFLLRAAQKFSEHVKKGFSCNCQSCPVQNPHLFPGSVKFFGLLLCRVTRFRPKIACIISFCIVFSC